MKRRQRERGRQRMCKSTNLKANDKMCCFLQFILDMWACTCLFRFGMYLFVFDWKWKQRNKYNSILLINFREWNSYAKLTVTPGKWRENVANFILIGLKCGMYLNQVPTQPGAAGTSVFVFIFILLRLH